MSSGIMPFPMMFRLVIGHKTIVVDVETIPVKVVVVATEEHQAAIWEED
jgi:hypothetical protein